MRMTRIARQAAKRAFHSLGYEVRRINGKALRAEQPVSAEKYRMAVNELHGAISELLFPHIPPSQPRRDLLAKLIGTPVSEAMYIVGHLRQSLHVEGAVCEFGIAQGATSALLAHEISHTQKELWLFDSFEGLPKPTSKDILIDDIFGLGSIDRYEGSMASPIEMVQARLADIEFPTERAHLVPGFVEQTLKSADLPDKVCFAYVDLDFYEPILTTLKWLRQSAVVGATVVVDDYGFFSSGAQTAVDEFMAETKTEFDFSLPCKFAAESTPFCILRRVSI